MGTTGPEYGKRRSKEEFLAWIDEWATSRCGLEQYAEFLRRNRSDKRMVEEAVPIAYYVRKRYAQAAVFVELNDQTTNHDGRICDENGSLVEHLEVTTVPEKPDAENPNTPRDVKDRLILAGEWRNKIDGEEEIVQKGFGLWDHMRQIENYIDIPGYADEAIKRVQDKATKDYPPKTTLLVVLSADMVTEEESRFAAIASRMRGSLPCSHSFSQIVVVDYTGVFMETL